MQMLYFVAMIAAFVCQIMVIVKAFQANKAVIGVIGIFCGIVAFVWGWMNVGKAVPKNLMMAWTALMVIGIICGFSAGAFTASASVGG